MAEEEDLFENPVFKTLRSKYAYLYERVESQLLTLCIPAANTITGIDVNEGFLMAHILTESPFFMGEYASMKGQVVCMENKNFTTGEGYPEKRTVTVLFEETFYNANDEKFTVLCISKPFEGTSPLDASGVPALPERRTVDECEKYLRCFPANQIVLRHIDEDIKKFASSYILVKGYEEDAGKKLKDLCIYAADMMACAVPTLRTLYSSCENDLLQLTEGYLFSKLHPQIFSALCMTYDLENDHALRLMQSARKIPMEAFGIEEKFQGDFRKAAETLRTNLSQAKSPMEMLLALKDCYHEMTVAIAEHCEKSMITGDDVLPLWIFVVCLAAPDHIQSYGVYMRCFSLSDIHSSELGYHYINFEASSEYIQSPQFISSLKSPDGRDLLATSSFHQKQKRVRMSAASLDLAVSSSSSSSSSSSEPDFSRNDSTTENSRRSQLGSSVRSRSKSAFVTSQTPTLLSPPLARAQHHQSPESEHRSSSSSVSTADNSHSFSSTSLYTSNNSSFSSVTSSHAGLGPRAMRLLNAQASSHGKPNVQSSSSSSSSSSSRAVQREKDNTVAREYNSLMEKTPSKTGGTSPSSARTAAATSAAHTTTTATTSKVSSPVPPTELEPLDIRDLLMDSDEDVRRQSSHDSEKKIPTQEQEGGEDDLEAEAVERITFDDLRDLHLDIGLSSSSAAPQPPQQDVQQEHQQLNMTTTTGASRRNAHYLESSSPYNSGTDTDASSLMTGYQSSSSTNALDPYHSSSSTASTTTATSTFGNMQSPSSSAYAGPHASSSLAPSASSLSSYRRAGGRPWPMQAAPDVIELDESPSDQDLGGFLSSLKKNAF